MQLRLSALRRPEKTHPSPNSGESVGYPGWKSMAAFVLLTLPLALAPSPPVAEETVQQARVAPTPTELVRQSTAKNKPTIERQMVAKTAGCRRVGEHWHAKKI
jgi:hypothetical protein